MLKSRLFYSKLKIILLISVHLHVSPGGFTIAPQIKEKTGRSISRGSDLVHVAEMAANADAIANAAHENGNDGSSSQEKGQSDASGVLKSIFEKVYAFGGIRFFVLMILCLQNSMFTVLRRYSLGVLKEEYSKVRRDYY